MVKKLKMNKTNNVMKTVMALSLLLFFVGGIIAQSSVVAESGVVGVGGETSGSTKGNEGVDVDPGKPIKSPNRDFVYMELDPVRQVADSGEWATYKLTIVDTHPLPLCPDTNPNFEVVCELPQYDYELAFDSGGLDYELDDKVSLTPGKKEVIKFSVSGKREGVNKFVITAKEISGYDNSKAKVVGYLLIDTVYPTPEKQFFFGEGFALSPDDSRGHLVDLKILIDEKSILKGKLKGKGTFDNRVYRIDGEFLDKSDNGVNFRFIGIDSNDVEMEFSGKILRFKHFSLLKGKIKSNNGESFMLTAFSKRDTKFQEIEIKPRGAVKSTSVGVNEIVSVTPEKFNEQESVNVDQADVINSGEEVYIRAVKVRGSKILFFIPNPWGKKVLELEITKGDGVYKEAINEKSSKDIEGYIVKVGSLEDENNIELDFKKA